MLMITPTAATVLSAARTEKGVPSDYGVRFFATSTADSDQARLAFNFVASPQPDDTVLKDGDIEAYVAPEVNDVIGDVVIDAETVGERKDLVVRRPTPTD